jgi:catechol 2,3-dioxygenase-like lactoylglutathione lyase family enzyme
MSKQPSPVELHSLVWLGVRTAQFDQTVRLYRDVFGLQPFHQDSASVRFRLPNGTEIHVYGPADDDHLFFGTAPVVGLLVDDVDRARAAMEAEGMEFLGPVQRAAGSRWNHFRGPDGNVYEILSRP